jgi:plasmid stability protein
MEHRTCTVSENQKVPSMLIRDLPDHLHRRLRVAAAYKGESFSDFGRRAVEREVVRVEAEMERDRRRRERER